MPTDQGPVRSNHKPFTPALSSNFRTNKTPITPKLAGTAPASPVISAKRDPLIRSLTQGRDNTASNSPLNGNITPRSGARNIRIGTESPGTPGATKDATPNRPRSTTSGAASKPTTQQTRGLGITSPRINTTEPPRVASPAATSPTPIFTVHRKVSLSKDSSQNGDELSSKFFRADDVKSVVEPPGSSLRSVQNQENSAFFYIGSPKSANESASSVQSSINEAVKDEKFFRANSVPYISSSRPVSRPELRTKKSFSSIASAQSQSIDTQGQTRFQGLQTSPGKGNRTTATEPSSPKRSPVDRFWPTSDSAREPVDRRKSVSSNASSARPVNHRKSMSTSSIRKTDTHGTTSPSTSPTKQRLAPIAATPIFGPAPTFERTTVPLVASPKTLSPRSTSLASSNTVPPSVTSDTDRSEASATRRFSLTAPATVITHSIDATTRNQDYPQTQVSQIDSAANARRERKVLDLEISNSSLLAINKTLEKELRKQNTELRRFRRLSRSGRLSILPSDRISSGSTLGTLPGINDDSETLSDLDADSDLDLLDDEDEGSILSNESNAVMSPTSKSRQRARDERRLMLDLSKHQQMLIDSQKLSQSIKHCITCTEELIREGNKALQYRVGIGDIKLGGRVLNHEDLDEKSFDIGHVEDRKPSQGLLSPSLTSTALMEASHWLGNSPGAMQMLDGVKDIDQKRSL